MSLAGNSRRRITRTLTAAYAGGLLSDETFARRLDEVLSGGVIEPWRLIGDVNLRAPVDSLPARLAARLKTVVGSLEQVFGEASVEPATLLALDWDGGRDELLLGRHQRCDVVLVDLTVSRRHARLIYRDGRWVLRDLASTNGTFVNGVRVGRCELRAGDQLRLGEQQLLID